VPLPASGHAALETGCQIVGANFKDFDDLSLLGVCNFHFMLCGHVAIYVERMNEPGFSGEYGR
jgi:hypothetical protein